ncbi:hypothetical protein BIW11_09542 [Tropilaelaps mercedesae]|uniref:Uncharacterized protein n=1 Tax=Tropilaelaps mercedesae TaxID=418985 RepID=A0A1V9XJN6_9ACAR|nr:hypothetical protein BIW11_09542 [Tropilaelaps mercedesae]
MTMSLFGVVVAGRLVQTEFETVDTNKFLLNIAEPSKVNHVTVFMTGVEPFPHGLGATVYFNLPNLDGTGSWHYLGYICNDKPSAIFKIGKNKQASSETHAFSDMMHQHNVGQMGISVENLADIQFMDSGAAQKIPPSVDSFIDFSKKMLESFYNYATSFAFPGPAGELCFPVRTLEQWFSNFERRLQQNPDFWKQQQPSS